MWPPAFIDGFNALDWALLAVLVISVLVGALRGLVYEVMALAGWVVAYVAAYVYGPRLPPLWQSDAPAVSAAMPLVGFALVFAGVLIVWNLLAMLLRLLVRATPLSGLDRLFGSVFGFGRGVLLLLAVALVVALTPWAGSAIWRQSQLVPVLDAAIATTRPWLPPGIGRWMPH